MNASTDTFALELLASKICHDLISPIGAVNNGVEFMQDMGADAGDEIAELISFSAGQASAKLQAYRMAYGAGGADGSIKPEDVHKILDALVGQEDKIKHSWDPYGPLGYEERPDAFCKLLMCAFLLAMDCLPKGGEIIIEAGDEPEQTRLIARGENASTDAEQEIALSLDAPVTSLTPKYIHPYVTGLLCQTYGFGISMSETSDDSVTILLNMPNA